MSCPTQYPMTLAGVAQAHFINNRTMEVFRQLPWQGHAAGSAATGCAQGAGGTWPGSGSALGSGSCGSLADAVAAASPPLEQWRRFVYCESALGRVLGEMDHFEVRAWTPGRFLRSSAPGARRCTNAMTMSFALALASGRRRILKEGWQMLCQHA